MPDEEKSRLLAEAARCEWLSLAAWAALAHSVHSVNNEVHQKLLVANATARLRYVAARAALHAYHNDCPAK